MTTESKRDKIRQSAAIILGGLVVQNRHEETWRLVQESIELAIHLERQLESYNV